MVSKDEYIQTVIKQGDEGSALLRARTAETLNNSEFVDVVDNKAVVRVPEGHVAVVHAATGDPNEDDVTHTASLVERLVDQAKKADIIPVGFANIVDSPTGDTEILSAIADQLSERANHHKIAVLNGENAILGPIVNASANISGAMISIAPKRSDFVKRARNGNNVTIQGVGQRIEYAFFDPQGQAVYINVDGVGTKTKFYEMTGQYHLAIDDLLAMNLDDTGKSGAVPRVVAIIAEFSHEHNDIFLNFLRHTSIRANEINFVSILLNEIVGDRLKAYWDGIIAFNLNGAVVSTIDEDMLENPLQSYAGDTVIAIRGKPNPRSNGISSKRKGMDIIGESLSKRYGVKHYSAADEGKHFLEFLAQPSTILYPLFRHLIDARAVSNVYHMSGGAFNGKFAKPLAEAGLYAELKNLFPADTREETLRQVLEMSQKDAYGQWPMGHDGFITTKTPGQAIAIITAHGLEGKTVGKVKRSTKTGLSLTTPSGDTVYFSGKD